MVSSGAVRLTQVIVGRLIAPIDDPLSADFVAERGEIDALADSGPGFLWRLKDDSGNATAIPAFTFRGRFPASVVAAG
jgi:hypothetical protein